MKCPQCRYDGSEMANFCSECGNGLKKANGTDSPAFSTPKPYTPKFLSDNILKSKTSIVGERKRVTVLFADVASYTSMSEKLDPEEVHQIMDGCFKILMTEIHYHNGTINQFTGDGVMALFGAPLALEDHAEDACHAALGIQNSMKNYARELERRYGVQFRLRIGINSGVVVVGSIGDDLRMDYTAIGDTTNLAARMESMAKPGTILVSPVTYKKVSKQFEFKSLGKVDVKGKANPLAVYELMRVRLDRPRLEQERRIYSEMVGRAKELNKLELQVNKAIDGDGSVVNVIGEAGIGKSRLIAELKNSSVMKRVKLLEGAALSTGRNLSFHPIIDLLKRWARISESDNEALSFSKLEALIKNVSLDHAKEIIPFVATIMSMKLSGKHVKRIQGIEGEALEKLIVKNIRDLFTKAAEKRPLVIVIEDFHWADRSSIELMKSLFRLSKTYRILFINVFRPAYNDICRGLIDAIRETLHVYYVEIKLGPLNEKNSEALIDNMLNIKGLHHEIKGRIVHRTGGNPFFIEEVVRSYLDEGAIIVKNGTFEVTDMIHKVVIPHTINDVLTSRIDRLDDETRELVKISSVIGRSFFCRLISEVATHIKDINEKLSFLKQIQLIRERKRMGEVEYVFKHAITQEVAYASILSIERTQLHLNVAKTIETVFQDQIFKFFGVLAYHYYRAEDMTKAEEYLIKAGEEALKTSASNEALHYYREALNLHLRKQGKAVDPEKEALLEKNIALALYNRGRSDEAIEYFDKVLNCYWKKLPVGKFMKVLMFVSAFFHFLLALYMPSIKFRKIPTDRDNEIGDLFFKKCQALIITHPKRFFYESFYLQKHVTKFDAAKFKLGIEPFISACALFSFTGLSFRLSEKVLHTAKPMIEKKNTKHAILYDLLKTQHNFFAGNWSAITAHDDDLVEKNLRNGEFWFASQSYFWHGLTYVYRGELTAAESIVTKLQTIYEIYENDMALMLKQLLNTCRLVELRKTYDALEEIETGIGFAKKTNQELALLHMLSCRARIYILMEAMDDARRSLEQAEKIRMKLDMVPWQLSGFQKGRLEYDLFRLKESMRNGTISNSAKVTQQACKSCRALLRDSSKVAQNRAESCRLTGLYYWLINKQKKALRWWRKAITEGERLGARLQLSRTYFEIGKRLSEPNSQYKTLNHIPAMNYLERAGTMFQEMNLQWDLDVLDQLHREKIT